MVGEKRYDHETLRTNNRAIIFSVIAAGRETSRFELAKTTGISPATVGAIVDDLISEGLIREMRMGGSTGGRRPVIVGLNPKGRTVLSGSLSVSGMSCTLIDLAGNILARRSIQRRVLGNDAAKALVEETAGGLMSDPASKALIGCVMNVPGQVRAADSLVLNSPPLKLSEFDLPGILKNLTGTCCQVYKDTDALLLAELRRGCAKGASNTVYVWVKAGVGMSYQHDSQLLILPRGGFELGHTASISGGSACHCGNTGCIGIELSEAHAIELYTRRSEGTVVVSDYIEICKVAVRGDRIALEVLSFLADTLGSVLANVVNLLNPELIVVGGPLHLAPLEFHNHVRKTVREKVLWPFKSAARIEFSALPDDSVLEAMGEEFMKNVLFPLP
ncbi:MAG: xylR [Spirochaetes bacterium]|nr:MAG: xylR [Spirochaetota bacterium]